MLTEQKNEIINSLSICARACKHCAHTCSQRKDHAELIKCTTLITDCELLCRNAAAVISRDSEYSLQVLKECIEMCRLCMRISGQLEHIECCRVTAIACSDCIRICEKTIRAMA